MNRKRNPDRSCRCQDHAARSGTIYLNAFCPHVAEHKPLADYGYPQTALLVGVAEYHRAWMAGEYNDSLPPNARPGYRPTTPGHPL
jgi:hypothetical protein